MPLSRRSFVRALGLAGTGALAAPLLEAPLLAARGREALAAGSPEPLDAIASAIRLQSNENPRGPSRAALDGIRAALGDGGRYPSEPTAALRDALAAALDVPRDHLLLGCGSTEILRVAVEACTGRERPLVAGVPTFETPLVRARALGTPIRELPLDAALRLDLDAMADAARGAGLVFLCNPNNPTGTLHGWAAMERAIHRVLAASPDAVVLVDEAYHEYVADPDYRSAVPLALAEPRVLVSRTFSKVYGLAGLRLGYAVAQPATLARLEPHLVNMSVNGLAAAAARGALADRALVARERALNAEARDFTRTFFARAGYTVAPSEANFLLVDVRRDTRDFQRACRDREVLVGRPFPPLLTHSRISIGTMDEMRAAVDAFRHVLGVRRA